jgi:hypothetical protein
MLRIKPSTSKNLGNPEIRLEIKNS